MSDKKRKGEVADVAVIGGGPAGAATALALRGRDPSLEVVLVEASTYGEARVGEVLAPHAGALLEELGVYERFLAEGHLAGFGTSSSWGQEELADQDFLFSVHGHGWHLDRRRFDAMLVDEAARRGVTAWLGTRLTGARRGANGWLLDLAGADRPTTLATRFVVDASGRRARFATRLGARRVVFDYLAGLFVFFDAGPGFADPRPLIEPVEQGWWYSAGLPGDGAVVALMTDSDAVRRLGLGREAAWHAACAATRHTRRRLHGSTARGTPAIHAASSGRLETVAGDGWLAVGDAASTFDPLSGLGMVKALRHGLWAAFAILDTLAGSAARPNAGERYRRHVIDEFEGYLETREHFYAGERRWPSAPFWRRRSPPITLAPDELLTRATGADRLLPGLRMHLPRADLERLSTLATPPRAAHQIVARFRESAGFGVSDRRIILALQYLLEKGALQHKPHLQGESHVRMRSKGLPSDREEARRADQSTRLDGRFRARDPHGAVEKRSQHQGHRYSS